MAQKTRKKTPSSDKRPAVPSVKPVKSDVKPFNWTNHRLEIQIGLALIVLTVAVYGRMLGHSFVNYDDNIYVSENTMVRAGLTRTGVSWALTTFFFSNWHPLTWLSLMLDTQLFGTRPFGYLLTNLVLHAANVALLFWVLRRMTAAVWPSAFVAALFAVHPLHVESVAWIAERKDVLSTLFGLLAMWAYVAYVERPASWNRYAAVLVALALGLAAKPMLVTLPFVFLLLDGWPLNRFPSPTEKSKWGETLWLLVREKIPMFALVAVSSVLTYLAQKQGGAVISERALGFGDRLQNAVWAYAAYLGKMIWPNPLVCYYTYDVSLAAWKIALAAIVLVGVTVGVIWTAKRTLMPAVGWFWYLGTLVPVIGLVQVGEQSMADRYTYVPLIGIFIVLTWGVAEAAKKFNIPPMVPAIVGSVVVLVLSFAAWKQVGVWQGDKVLYNHTLAYSPNAAPIRNNLGRVLYNEGKIEEAIVQYRRVVETNPKFALAQANLGEALVKLNRPAEAVPYFTQAAMFQSGFKAYLQLANAFRLAGNLDAAVETYSRVIEMQPRAIEAHYDLAEILAEQGRYEEALTHYSAAAQLRTNYRDVQQRIAEMRAKVRE